MSVALKNISGRVIHIQLVHPRAPKMRQTYKQTTLDRRSGKVGVRRMKLSVPQSLILLANEQHENLPMWVAEVPEVARLVARKKLEVIITIESDRPSVPAVPTKPKRMRKGRSRSASKKRGG